MAIALARSSKSWRWRHHQVALSPVAAQLWIVGPSRRKCSTLLLALAGLIVVSLVAKDVAAFALMRSARHASSELWASHERTLRIARSAAGDNSLDVEQPAVAADVAPDAEGAAGEKVARVVPTTDVSRLGVALGAWVTADGQAVVKGMGANTTSLMIKAVIRAAKEVWQNEVWRKSNDKGSTPAEQLAFFPTFEKETLKNGEEVDMLHMTLKRVPKGDDGAQADIKTMRASGGTNAGKLAGAIVGTLKKGQGVEIAVLGAPSVAKAVKSIMISQIFARSDDPDAEVGAIPRFVRGTKEGNKVHELILRIVKV